MKGQLFFSYRVTLSKNLNIFYQLLVDISSNITSSGNEEKRIFLLKK